MPSPELQELLRYVDELIEATREGTFQWKSVNPTTFIWQSAGLDGTGARLSVQRVDESFVRLVEGKAIPTKRVFFLLQANEIPHVGPPVEKIKVSGRDDLELNDKLQKLFTIISSGLSQQGLRFLKGLLPPKQK